MVETFEDLLDIVGSAGRWQVRTFLLVFFSGFPAALQDFLYIFIAAVPDHWCKIPSCESHSLEEVKHLIIPRVDRDGQSKFSSCHRFDLEVESRNGVCIWPTHRLTNVTVPCKAFDFDQSTFESTITTEWGLVCDEEFWRSTSQAVYIVGGLCGSLMFGIIADNYGRKLAVVTSTVVCAIFGPIVALSPSFKVFMVARFLLSAGSPGLFEITHVLVFETVGWKFRGLAGNVFGIPYSLGYAATAAFAYQFRNWRHLQLVTTVPVAMFLFVLYFVPESPRWLLSQGKAKEAEEILRSMAKTNGMEKNVPGNFSNLVSKLSMKEISKKKESGSARQKLSLFFQQFLSLVRTPKMRGRTLVLNFCWFASVLGYDGGAFNAPNLSANLFLYIFVSGLLEIPSCLIVPPLIRIFGRRPIFSASYFLSAMALSTSLVFTPGTYPVVLLAWLGIFSIAASYSLIFVYGAEIMPTTVRSCGLGFAAVIGSGGGLVGLYATDLLGRYERMAPTAVLAAVSLAAGFLALLLPETNKEKLPESVDDVENSG